MQNTGNIRWWNYNCVWLTLIRSGVKILVVHPVFIPLVFNISRIIFAWNFHVYCFLSSINFSRCKCTKKCQPNNYDYIPALYKLSDIKIFLLLDCYNVKCKIRKTPDYVFFSSCNDYFGNRIAFGFYNLGSIKRT